MKKIFKFSIFLFILFFISITSVHALDINMNLQSNTVNNQTSENANTNTLDENTVSNNELQNNNTNNSVENMTDSSSDNGPRVTSTSSEDEFLTIENILAIIIIVIGILLVFLSIAILIKFK